MVQQSLHSASVTIDFQVQWRVQEIEQADTVQFQEPDR